MEINNIIAKTGKILTNGEVFGKSICLGINDSAENWWEITEEEYEKIHNSSIEELY